MTWRIDAGITGVMTERGPELPAEGWSPPAGARVDPTEEWRASRLSERELAIATVVGVVAAIAVPFVGLMIAIVLLADRHIPHGIGVMLVALLSSPIFPIWG